MVAKIDSALKLVKWKCHKVVEAAKIVEIEGNSLIVSCCKVRIDLEVSPDYIERHKPEVGGFYVRYEDGYESYSPAEAFEAGYTMLVDGFSTDYPKWRTQGLKIAFKIGQLNYAPDGGCVISPEDPALASVSRSVEWCEEERPRVGGYMVKADMGWNYRDADYFESMFVKLTD